MKAAIVIVGDEILIGQVVDTNSAYIAAHLTALGFDIVEIDTVSDCATDISSAIKNAAQKASLVIMTGGLGPTKDDITKKVLADYFNVPIVPNAQAFDWLKQLFAVRGRTIINELTQAQALLPQNCTPLKNEKGTACGMMFEENSQILISLPGVPFEMEHLMQTQVLPLLKAKCADSFVAYRVLKVYGIAESDLAIQLTAFEDNLPADLKLAYLPATDLIRLRLTSKGSKQLDDYYTKLKAALGPLSFTEGEGNNIQARVADVFTKNKLKLAVAESCTGGALAASITQLAGASCYFAGGVVAYSNNLKINALGVNAADIEHHGAVSGQVVKQMALGALKLTGADYAVATSGIAGPSGGTPQKPVGTVWIAVACKDGRGREEKFSFSNVRERNIPKTVTAALQMLLDFIIY